MNRRNGSKLADVDRSHVTAPGQNQLEAIRPSGAVSPPRTVANAVSVKEQSQLSDPAYGSQKLAPEEQAADKQQKIAEMEPSSVSSPGAVSPGTVANAVSAKEQSQSPDPAHGRQKPAPEEQAKQQQKAKMEETCQRVIKLENSRAGSASISDGHRFTIDLVAIDLCSFQGRMTYSSSSRLSPSRR